MAEDDLTINVWVGNLGRYNEGTLIGGWLRLPVDEQRIDRFLTEQVGLTIDAQQAYEIGRQGGVVYEEYGILDYEYDGLLAALDYRPGEYEDLHALNTLAQAARIFTQDRPEALEAVRLAADMNNVHDPVGLANLLVQAEDIEYMAYDPPQGITRENTPDLDEMYGWHCANRNSELASLLDGPYGMYFDVAKYGRDASINDNVTLADHGFLIDEAIPDTKRYSGTELTRIVDAHGDDEPGLSATPPPESDALRMVGRWGDTHDNVMRSDGAERIAERIMRANDSDDNHLRQQVRDLIRPVADQLDGDMPSGSATFARLVAEHEAMHANSDQMPAQEPFRLESLLEPGEHVMEYTLAGTATNWGAPVYQCIMPIDSTDIGAGLEDTLQRIIADRAGHGDADTILAETMGTRPIGELDPADGITPIDQGYALPAPITSFNPRPVKEEKPDTSKGRDTVLDGIRQRAGRRADDPTAHPPAQERAKTRNR